MTAIEEENHVRRLFIRLCPTILLHHNHLSLAVLGIVNACALGTLQSHEAAIDGLISRDIAIVDVKGRTSFPIRFCDEALPHSANAQGMDVSVLVLPTLLQKAEGFTLVNTRHSLTLAESRFLDAFLAAIKLYLIVKLNSLGAFGKGNARRHLAHGVGSTRDGFHHLAQKQATSRNDRHIHDAHSLA